MNIRKERVLDEQHKAIVERTLETSKAIKEGKKTLVIQESLLKALLEHKEQIENEIKGL